MPEPILQVRGLSVDFSTEDGFVHAVRGVTFDLHPGEALGVVGESGSGKSVSSMALMGLLPRTARTTGSVLYRGEELVGRSNKQMRPFRGSRIAMIFQDPMTSLNPVHTIGRQIAEAVLAHHDVPRGEAWRRAVHMLDVVGIPQADRRASSYPHEFSGGMRQRAMIAMAIVNDPDVIIADEPTTALDVTVQAQIIDTLNEIRERTSAGMILITHDLGVIAGMVDRVQVMYAGRVVETGSVDDIFYRPRMPYTAGLLGSMPSLEGESKRLVPIKGAPPSLINLPPGCPFSPRCPLVEDHCQANEPPLGEVGPGHQAACFRSHVLAEYEDPRELFLGSRA